MLLSRYLLALPMLWLSMSAAAELALGDPWIRALPPTQKVTAAYVAITNRGDEALVLQGARIEGAGKVEIHTTREVDGLLRMEQLSTLTIPPGETRELAPGGAHFMLFDLAVMPRPGESRQMCLVFADGLEQCATATVRKSADHGGHDHHQHH